MFMHESLNFVCTQQAIQFSSSLSIKTRTRYDFDIFEVSLISLNSISWPKMKKNRQYNR